MEQQLLARPQPPQRRIRAACDLHHSSQHCWILNPLSRAGGQTHIHVDSSRVLNLLSHNGNSKKMHLEQGCHRDWAGAMLAGWPGKGSSRALKVGMRKQQNDRGICLAHSGNSGEVAELEVRARGQEEGGGARASRAASCGPTSLLPLFLSTEPLTWGQVLMKTRFPSPLAARCGPGPRSGQWEYEQTECLTSRLDRKSRGEGFSPCPPLPAPGL